MISKWYELKDQATKLRVAGHSLREVESKLEIPRSTLSGWFKNVHLTRKQKNKLNTARTNALKLARVKAVRWHNTQKKLRLAEAEKQAKSVVSKLMPGNKNELDLALSFLYLGEGFKKTNETGLGNSDPLILKFFIQALNKNYGIAPNKIKCELHLRADQNPQKLKKYWSRELQIPIKNFTSVSIDKRTLGKPTYDYYKGVCVLRCGTVAIQRRLSNISRLYIDKILK